MVVFYEYTFIRSYLTVGAKVQLGTQAPFCMGEVGHSDPQPHPSPPACHSECEEVPGMKGESCQWMLACKY